jgi:hypothetical protein
MPRMRRRTTTKLLRLRREKLARIMVQDRTQPARAGTRFSGRRVGTT